MKFPVAAPDLSALEEQYALEAIRSSWISSTGPFVDRFERDFASLCGVRAAVSVSSGTTALHLALMALEVCSGDEVLVPSLTYIAAANTIRYVGAEPVFVDVDPGTWCIDPSLLEASITPKTKGIVVVHLYGHPADMDAINGVARRHNLWVVEDAAEAHYAQYKGRPVGGLGTIGVFSFYGNKIVTSGEGGAVTVSDPALERRVRLLRGQGMDPDRRYFFPVIGYNYRLTNVACGLLCAQLERSSVILAARNRVFEDYTRALINIPGIGLQPQAPWANKAPWLYSVTVDSTEFGSSREELMARLAKEGIETRPFFIPVHQLPPYKSEQSRTPPSLDVTDNLGRCGINLPTYSSLSRADVIFISNLIRAISKE